MRKPSPAVIIATASLFFSLGGVGVAASGYVIQNTQQIRPRVLRALQGATGRRGATGRQGRQGVAGTAGPIGSTGTFSTQGVVVVDGPVATMASGAVGTSIATCPLGDTVLSGGNAGPLVATTLTASQPLSPNQWEVVVDNTSVVVETAQAIVVCSG